MSGQGTTTCEKHDMDYYTCPFCAEEAAADRITALEAEVEALKKENAYYKEAFPNMQIAVENAGKQITTFRADRERLVNRMYWLRNRLMECDQSVSEAIGLPSDWTDLDEAIDAAMKK